MDNELKWTIGVGLIIALLGLIGAGYALLAEFPVTDREPAGHLVSVARNPSDFLTHETWAVTTTTHCLTTLVPLSAHRDANCEIITTSDGCRWLEIDGKNIRCRVLP
jgi:hypothetical protein